MIRTLIIEDEVRNQRMLNQLLVTHCPNISIIGIYESVVDGISQINQLKPELVFLDIQLKDGNGFDILTQLEDHVPSIIFTTAYDQFAIKAFKFSAVDYLLKPIIADELKAAVAKVDPKNDHALNRLNALLSKVNVDKEKYIKVASQRQIEYLRVNDILRLEANGNYTSIYLINGTQHVVSKVLKEYASKLIIQDFYRVHQSHLINLACVSSYDKSNQIVKMMDGSNVPVSRNERELFLEKMNGRSLI